MKKFCKNYLYYHLVADILIALVAGLAFIDAIFIEDEAGEVLGVNMRAIPFFIAALVVLYGVLILYRVFYLRTASYTLTENEIRVTRGVLFRKNSIVDYKRMHAINKKQNIVQRLFGLAVLTVDSGSANTSTTAEILIYETTAEVDRLLAELKARKNGESVEAAAPAQEVIMADGGDLVFSSGKKLMYSLLNIGSALLTMVTVILLALITYFCLVPVLYDLLVGGIFFPLLTALVIALIVTVGIAICTFIGSILQSFVGYHNFRIRKNATDLEISYGLLTRHTNTFGFDRIQGVVVRQGLIRRLFGYATLSLEVIGYHEGGDEGNNQNIVAVGILLPLCQIGEVESVISSILAPYVPLKKEVSAKQYFPFISWSLLLIGAITALTWLMVLPVMRLLAAPAVACAIVRILLLCAFVIAAGLHAFGAFLAFKNAGLAVSEDRITVFGGGYQKRVTTLLHRSLVAVEDVTTPMRARAGIYTLILHLRTNAATNEVKVEMLDKASVDRLLAVLED